MGYAKRVDGTHRAIVQALRQVGWFVHDTSGAGNGYPDLTCARAGRLELVEVKTATGKLKPKQEQFMAAMFAKGIVVKVLRRPDEAAAL